MQDDLYTAQVVQIQPRKHVRDHVDYTDCTRQRELTLQIRNLSSVLPENLIQYPLGIDDLSGMCVLHIKPLFYRSTSSTSSVRADSSSYFTEIQALWSKKHGTEILHCNAKAE